MPRLRDVLQLSASALLSGGIFALPLLATMLGQTRMEYEPLPEPGPRIAFSMPAPEPEPSTLKPSSKPSSKDKGESDSNAKSTQDDTAKPKSTIQRPQFDNWRTRKHPTNRLPGRATRSSNKQRKARKIRKCVAKTEGITERSPAEFHVERQLMQYYSGHLGQAAKLAAVRWHKTESGKVDGFRVGGIRCGSVLHQMGLRSGDVIHTINRQPIASIPQALGTFKRLKKRETFRVRLTRRGQSKQLKYTVS
jgi:hypothetical protein